MTTGDEHHFMCLSVTCLCSLGKCLFKLSAHFFPGCFLITENSIGFHGSCKTGNEELNQNLTQFLVPKGTTESTSAELKYSPNAMTNLKFFESLRRTEFFLLALLLSLHSFTTQSGNKIIVHSRTLVVPKTSQFFLSALAKIPKVAVRKPHSTLCAHWILIP